jgi:thioredoxin 1
MINEQATQSSARRAPDTIVSLSHADFTERVIEGDGPIVVEFMSPTCSHCEALAPVLRRVAEQLRGREKVFCVDIDAEPNLAANFSIDGTPTILLFQSGQEIGRLVGPSPDEATLLAALTEPFEA